MILQSLYEYYQRKVNTGSADAAPQGFEWKSLPFLVVIDREGQFLSIEDTREESTPKGRKFLLPRAEQHSGSNSWATTNFLWDHIGYVLGHAKSDGDEAKNAKNKELANRQHGTWLSLLERLDGADADNVAIEAIRKFYSSRQEQNVRNSDKWAECIKISGCNVAFRLDGDPVPVPCKTSIQQFLQTYQQPSTNDAKNDDESISRPLVGRCLVTGDVGLIARIHIKTPINKDCKTLVGFQKNSGYDSYGKEQAYNSPVSQSAEAAYTTALKMMLAEGSHNRIRIGDTVMLFWSDGATQLEGDFPFFWQPAPDDPDKGIRAIQTLLESPRSGASIPEERSQFYVLGLAPGGGSRIAIRYWHAGSVAEFAAQIRQHFLDLRITAKPGHLVQYALFSLLRQICLDGDLDRLPPSLPGEIIRAALTGQRYPAMLLQQTVRRIRAEQCRKGPHDENVTTLRASLLKAYLLRSQKHQSLSEREITVALDLENCNPAYRLGRLFAVLEKIQEDAQRGINATIRDRYYGAASSTPVTAFPQLLKLKNHHLAKIENPAFRTAHEKRLTEIFSGLSADMPTHLSMEDQARFAIGYYHQRQALFTKTSTNDATTTEGNGK